IGRCCQRNAAVAYGRDDLIEVLLKSLFLSSEDLASSADAFINQADLTFAVSNLFLVEVRNRPRRLKGRKRRVDHIGIHGSLVHAVARPDDLSLDRRSRIVENFDVPELHHVALDACKLAVVFQMRQKFPKAERRDYETPEPSSGSQASDRQR